MPKSARRKARVTPLPATLLLVYVDGASEEVKGPLFAVRDLLAEVLADADVRVDLARYELRQAGQVLERCSFVGGQVLTPIAHALRGAHA